MSEYYLVHHGIKGQKWGVRRYQNEDGSYTEAGKSRYRNSDGTLNAAGKKRQAARDKWIEDRKRTIRSLQDRVNNSKESYEDLRKNGVKSETFRDAYGTETDSDFEDIYGFSKEEGLRVLKENYQDAIAEAEKYNPSVIKDIQHNIKQVINTPLDSDSYVEASARNSTLANTLFLGALAGSMAAGVAAAVKTDSAGLGQLIFLGGSVVSAIGIGGISTKNEIKNRQKYGIR